MAIALFSSALRIDQILIPQNRHISTRIQRNTLYLPTAASVHQKNIPFTPHAHPERKLLFHVDPKKNCSLSLPRPISVPQVPAYLTVAHLAAPASALTPGIPRCLRPRSARPRSRSASYWVSDRQTVGSPPLPPLRSAPANALSPGRSMQGRRVDG